jgi:glycosyltransferase involved in cell wall biosynthesis
MFPWLMVTAREVLDGARRGEFDVIHMHLESLAALLAEASPVPVIATHHGRVDHPALGRALRGSRAHNVAISAHQASTQPEATWAAVVHNGLDLAAAPFERRRDDALVFVGRVSPEKGVLDAIEIARRVGRPLRIIAKVGPEPHEQEYYRSVFKPALDAAGSDVEFIGELDAASRDQVVAVCHATLMAGAWPEPFGLVAIESLACGTPVIARRVGALPEIVREGIDGFFGDDVPHLASLVDRVATLDREQIRRDVIDRFSSGRMADGYETLMRSVLSAGGSVERLRPRLADRSPAATKDAVAI